MQKENGFKQIFIEENIQMSLILNVMLLVCSSSVALTTINVISGEPALLAYLLTPRDYCVVSFLTATLLGTNPSLYTESLICITLQYRNNLVTKMHIFSFPFGFLKPWKDMYRFIVCFYRKYFVGHQTRLLYNYWQQMLVIFHATACALRFNWLITWVYWNC